MSTNDLMPLVVLRLAKWASSRNDFDGLRVDGLFHNWKVPSFYGPLKVRKVLSWSPPRGEFKFNVDEVC